MVHYNGGYRPFTTTNEDHSGIALVVTALLGRYTVLCCTVRIYARSTATGPVGKDDLCCMLGTVRITNTRSAGLLSDCKQLLCTAQTITTGIAIYSGFGRGFGLLSSADVLHTLQAFFAAELLYYWQIQLPSARSLYSSLDCFRKDHTSKSAMAW